MSENAVFWEGPQGKLRIPSYVYACLGAVLLASFFGVAVLGLIPYGGDYPALGWVDYRQAPVKIYSNTPGVIEEIYVEEGSLVNKDAPLLSVKNNDTLSAETLYADDFRDVLKQKLEDIGQQRDSELAAYRSQVDGINSSIRHVEEDLDAIEQQILINRQKTEVITGRKTRQSELLLKGYVSQDSFDLLDIELLTVQNQLQELMRSRNAMLQAKENALASIESASWSHEDKLAEFRTREGDIRLQLLESDRRNGYIIRAPISGVVNNVNAFLGSMMSSVELGSTPLLTILPAYNEINIFFLIPSELAVKVRVGDMLELRIRSNVDNKVEEVSGMVNYRSPLMLTREELESFPIAVSLAESYYLAKVSPILSADADLTKLQPGVSLQTNIPLEKTNVLAWLFDHFLQNEERVSK